MSESLKDSLSRAADEVGSAEPDLQAIERRGRRRRTRRYGITGIVAVLVTAAVALPLYGLAGLGGSHSTPLGPGQIVRYDVGGAPQPIAAGGGAAWVSVSEVSSDGTGPTVLRRIDATTGAVTDIPGANGAVWPAAGPEGVWATCNQETCGPGVVELDPATGDVLRTIPVGGSRLWQITTGLGSVWVTTNGTVGSVTRIDPESGEVVSSFEGRYNLVAVGGDSVWATRSESPGGVVQLDPDTGKVLSTFAFPDPCYLNGTDTQVFVESCDGGSHAGTTSDELVALDARTGEVQYRIPIDGYGQMRVADGTLWIAENDPTGTQIRLVRLDPATGTSQGDPFVVARGSAKENDVGMLGPPSVFFATDGESLWLTDFSAGQVIRVALPLPSPTPTPSVAPIPTPTSNPSDQDVLAPYVNPMGIPLTLAYPSDWYAASVSQPNDLDPNVANGLLLGVVISNSSGAMPPVDPAAPSPGPLPQDPQLPPDFVTVTILSNTVQTAPNLPDTPLPLSMAHAKVAPGLANMRMLSARVGGLTITITVQGGPDASEADLARADAIVASIRPSTSAGPNVSVALLSPSPAPVIEGTTLSGGSISAGDLQGKVLVVGTWASWCVPCRSQLEVLQRIAEANASNGGVLVLGLNVDDDSGAASAMAGQQGVTFPSIVVDRALAADLGIHALPSLWVIDAQGRVIWTEDGAPVDPKDISSIASLAEQVQAAIGVTGAA